MRYELTRSRYTKKDVHNATFEVIFKCNTRLSDDFTSIICAINHMKFMWQADPKFTNLQFMKMFVDFLSHSSYTFMFPKGYGICNIHEQCKDFEV